MSLITLEIDPNQIQGQLAQSNLSATVEREYALAVDLSFCHSSAPSQLCDPD